MSKILLFVEVVAGRKLAAKDKNGFSDPFVILNIGDETHQTQVVNKNLDPKWDAVFSHNVNADDPPTEILMTVWDKDAFGKDYMGEVTIPLDARWANSGFISYDDPNNKPKWYQLTNASRPSIEVSGELLVKVGLSDAENKFLSSQDIAGLWKQFAKVTVPDTPTMDSGVQAQRRRYSGPNEKNLSGTCFIEVLRAVDLPPEPNAAHTGFDMDPFVVISFAKQTFRTRVISHSLNPEWNDKLYFTVAQSEMNYNITFAVYDWDKFTDNDFVGRAELPIRELVEKSKHKQSSYDPEDIEAGMSEFVLDIPLKPKERNKDLKTKLYIRGKFVAYTDIRIQFWHVLAKVYDADGNGVLSFVELQTMLNSLGSSLTDATIENFFVRYRKSPHSDSLSFDEVVECLEQRLREQDMTSASPDGEESDNEHLIYLKECPICHRPKMETLSESAIITHVAACASTDWRNVDKFLVGDFVTESQAQRKWLAKVITKVSYGNYKIGANNANILVQDRLSGKLVEEKMPTYIRLGIRLLYKGVGQSAELNRTKRLLESLSKKQGDKFNNPNSCRDIKPFIEFHKLDIDEILDPLDSFKNFNEFFYRKLKPTARPCDSPKDSRVLVSPADCRMMAFPTINNATQIWIKGTNFSLERLFKDPKVAKEFENGSLGIFRLAPQDYHRFHFPVDGTLSEVTPIAGDYYTVNPMAIRSELDVYGENKRAVCFINSPKFGKVAFIAVGAMMVGSIVFTSKPHTNVKRGDEHGYFAFGGSTVLLLFQKGKMTWDKDLLENSEQALETLVRVGMHVGRAS